MNIDQTMIKIGKTADTRGSAKQAALPWKDFRGVLRTPTMDSTVLILGDIILVLDGV